MDYEQALLVEREQRIRRIESDMLDCNQIFKDLANIVHEQGDVIDTIEGNIESTQHNTGQAVEQLRSAANYQRKYRRKTCCLLVLVVVGGCRASPGHLFLHQVVPPTKPGLC
ncbi:hypothetical protein MRX96_014467 [Rhipicephalus microplus]